MVEETPREQEKASPQHSTSKLSSLKNKVEDLRAHPHMNRAKMFLSQNAIEVVSGLLVLFGIVLGIFSRLGGLFVASGVVLCFSEEIRSGLRRIRDYYSKNSPVKNAILGGLFLFFLMRGWVFVASFLVLCCILVLLKHTPEDDSSN